MSAPVESPPAAEAVPGGTGGRWLGRVSTPRPRPVLRWAERWSLFVGLVIVWQLVTLATRNSYFPTPLTIAQEAGHLWFSGPAAHLWLAGPVFDDIFPSIGRLLAGWIISVVLGVLIGLGLGRSPVACDYFGGLLAFARSVPPPTMVPVFLVLFKIGPEMEIVTIVFGTIWPVLLNTIDGARSVDPLTMDAARSFHTPWRRRVLNVVLPAAGPKIFAGLRVSLSIAFILMVISELVGSTNGIGFQLTNAQNTFDLSGMWAWIVLVSALGYLFNSVLVIVEHRVLRWYRGATSQSEG